jgi:iron-sulfur cluster assembly 2
MISRRLIGVVTRRVGYSIRTAPVKTGYWIGRPLLARTIVSKPTLGPDAEQPHVNIRNPYKNDEGELLSIKLTSRAADKLNSIKTGDSNPDLTLRIEVESGGCHGFQYIFSLKNKNDIDENDSVFELNGAEVVIDNVSLGFLRDSTVDYTSELIGSQFKIVDSPYTTSSCGCGASFDFDPNKGAK